MQRLQGRRVAAVPGRVEIGGEALEAKARDLAHQLLAVAEVPVGRGRADTGQARGLGDGEAGWPLLADQAQRRLDQRFAQVSVMISAASRAAWLKAHVMKVYIEPRALGKRSLAAQGTLVPGGRDALPCSRRSGAPAASGTETSGTCGTSASYKRTP